MTLDEVRRTMNRCWERADREALATKDSHVPLDRLHALYRSLAPTERKPGDQVLAEWVLSPEEVKRFDAIALIREFGVKSTESALRQLVDRLEGSDEPGARFEREKALGLLAELADSGPGPRQH